MTTIDLELLGLTQEDLRDRVVDRIAEQMLSDVVHAGDPDDEDAFLGRPSRFADAIQAMVEDRIRIGVEEVAAKHVLPEIGTVIENFCLQKTNEWGEKRGDPVTFTEYLVQRAEAYMQEPVNFQGKTKAEDGYGWQQATTRIAYMVDKHLQYEISRAMEGALKTANESIKEGLANAVRAAIQNVKVTVDTKVKRS